MAKLTAAEIVEALKEMTLLEASELVKSIEETFPIIRAQGDVEIVGLMVSLNRMERGKAENSAFTEIRETYGFPVNAIVSMADVLEYLAERGQAFGEDLAGRIRSYYEQYGAPEYREQLLK